MTIPPDPPLPPPPGPMTDDQWSAAIAEWRAAHAKVWTAVELLVREGNRVRGLTLKDPE